MSGTCHDCVHRINQPGNCHIACNSPLGKRTLQSWSGCGVFPLLFDESIVSRCESWSNRPEDRKPEALDPLMDVLRILTVRR